MITARARARTTAARDLAQSRVSAAHDAVQAAHVRRRDALAAVDDVTSRGAASTT